MDLFLIQLTLEVKSVNINIDFIMVSESQFSLRQTIKFSNYELFSVDSSSSHLQGRTSTYVKRKTFHASSVLFQIRESEYQYF